VIDASADLTTRAVQFLAGFVNQFAVAPFSM